MLNFQKSSAGYVGSIGKPDECVLTATPCKMSQAIVYQPILRHVPKY